jgi:hypothetical protein
MQYRSSEYEARGDELAIEKSGGFSERGQGPKGAAAADKDGWYMQC